MLKNNKGFIFPILFALKLWLSIIFRHRCFLHWFKSPTPSPPPWLLSPLSLFNSNFLRFTSVPYSWRPLCVAPGRRRPFLDFFFVSGAAPAWFLHHFRRCPYLHRLCFLHCRASHLYRRCSLPVSFSFSEILVIFLPILFFPVFKFSISLKSWKSP